MQPITLPTEPYAVTSDTYLIPTVAAEPSGTFISAHSMVIQGEEPVIVDTGCLLVRDAWTENAFSVVAPEDVRWIVISHDDHDHLGNLDVVLEQCPQATLVASYPIVARLAGDIELPLERMQWRNEGEALVLPDRELRFVRPPMFDSPATRGIFDTTTGVLWGADSFGSALPGAVYEAGDVPDEMYADSFHLLNQMNTPWLEWVDPERFETHLQTTAALPVTAWASAHGPVFRGEQIADAFDRTRALVGAPAVDIPNQEILELLLAMLSVPADLAPNRKLATVDGHGRTSRVAGHRDGRQRARPSGVRAARPRGAAHAVRKSARRGDRRAHRPRARHGALPGDPRGFVGGHHRVQGQLSRPGDRRRAARRRPRSWRRPSAPRSCRSK